MIYPCHMNPNIRKLAHECLDGCSQVLISEPMEVYDFHNLIRHAYLILSDSGGIQEEAPSLGKPVLVLRDTTERPEGIAAGTLKLVGTDTDSIVRETSILLDDPHAYAAMANAVNPYGDGRASERITDALISYFERNAAK